MPLEEQVAGTKKVLTDALERVGVNVESMEFFAEISMIAAISAPAGRYFEALKLCEKGIPEKLQVQWRISRDGLQSTDLVRKDAATSFSSVPPWISLLAGILLAPFVTTAAILNFLPLAGALWAGKKIPDERNVITLWRILVGVPLFFLWFVAIFAGLALAGRGSWLLLFLILTMLGWCAYQLARQLLVSGLNGIRFPGLRRKYLDFQKALFAEMRNHEP